MFLRAKYTIVDPISPAFQFSRLKVQRFLFLAHLPGLPDDLSERTQLVHFRESVRDNQMTFDYRLRAGPVLAGNALRLMRQVGLDVPLD